MSFKISARSRTTRSDTNCWSENRIKKISSGAFSRVKRFCALQLKTGGAIPLVLEHLKITRAPETDLHSNWFELFFSVPAAGLLAPTDLSSSAEHDVVTDAPLGCSSWFPFDVPAGPSSSSSACSWFLSLHLVHYAPAGSTWPPPNNEQLTQLWTSPLLIQLPFTKKN
ncbi:hypothetical protein F511_26534 [Dorcoceras hygrometricum]|uniref:Uncharacterized protein n=1 Tax=Dorcoceras hygrometricum TaxID=472368 RepID=A0A2Z7BZJ2_9LAMI|nr:hypothetical protein F511_26534 [Dorcoceras hygrometricum]